MITAAIGQGTLYEACTLSFHTFDAQLTTALSKFTCTSNLKNKSVNQLVLMVRYSFMYKECSLMCKQLLLLLLLLFLNLCCSNTNWNYATEDIHTFHRLFASHFFPLVQRPRNGNKQWHKCTVNNYSVHVQCTTCSISICDFSHKERVKEEKAGITRKWDLWDKFEHRPPKLKIREHDISSIVL